MVFILSLMLYSKDYNCRIYKNETLLKSQKESYAYHKEKELFSKNITLNYSKGSIKFEHYKYEGFNDKNNSFVVYFLNKEDAVIKKIDLSSKNIDNFQATKRDENNMVLLLETPNGEGENIDIFNINIQLMKLQHIFEVKGRDGFLDREDIYTLGDIEVNSKGEFIFSLQLVVYGGEKNIRNHGNFIYLYKIDKQNNLVWKKFLVVSEFEERFKDKNIVDVKIKDDYLYVPYNFNRFTNMKYKSGCYLIANHIVDFYGYFAIDEDGNFWTRDVNLTKKRKKIVTSMSKEIEMSQKDWISFIGFLLLIFIYFIYKKVRGKS